MITENGSIKTEFVPCERADRQYNRLLQIISAICLALGSAGICVYLTFDILSVFNITYEPPRWILIILAVPFAFGLIFTIGLRRAYRAARKGGKAMKTECEFFADHFTFVRIADGEETVSAKIYYAQITRRMESKDYIFASADRVNVITVDKNALSAGEVNAIRVALGLPADGEECVTLPNGAGKEAENNAENEKKDVGNDENE